MGGIHSFQPFFAEHFSPGSRPFLPSPAAGGVPLKEMIPLQREDSWWYYGADLPPGAHHGARSGGEQRFHIKPSLLLRESRQP
jgi:hypothetical protein